MIADVDRWPPPSLYTEYRYGEPHNTMPLLRFQKSTDRELMNDNDKTD